MAIPVVLAETIALCELYLLFTRQLQGGVRIISRAASILVGVYFLGVFIYVLINAVIPITQAGQWRDPADILAVSAYLAGIVPLTGMALLDLGWLDAQSDPAKQLKRMSP